MKVLLTGAGGFIGTHLLRLLRQRGIDHAVAGRHRPAGLSNAAFWPIDLLDASRDLSWMRAVDATHLVHLAWVTEPGSYWTSPMNQRWVEASVRLVQSFCLAGGQHVVAAGSCAEYDWSHARCDELGTPLKPATVYGAAKNACRKRLQVVCAEHGVALAWARIFFPFGSGEDTRRLLPSLIKALRGAAAPFGVNGDTARDFVHVSDVATALLAMLQPAASGPYNVSTGEPVRIADIVRFVARSLSADPRPLLALPCLRDAGPAVLAGDNGRLRSLGWQPATSLDAAIADTVRACIGYAARHALDNHAS